MTLQLHFHPLSSFSQKVLIAFYENGTDFERRIVELGDARSRKEFLQIWPMCRMPVLRDTARDRTVPESTIIIEYLAQHYPGPVELCPADPDLARQTRLRDRFYDLYVQQPMQKVVGDLLRPAGCHDPHGVSEAKAMLKRAYDMIDYDMEGRTWAMGEAFTMADCAAAPALYYAHEVMPFGDGGRNVARYLGRLMGRPSFARVMEETRPYRSLFPD